MKTIVVGKCMLSNGKPPMFHIEVNEWIFHLSDSIKLRYNAVILAGHITIEFLDELNYSDDDIFRISRHIVEAAILTQILKNGTGVTYALESCRKADNSGIFAIPDTIKEPKAIFDENKLVNLIGANISVRWTIRDFNNGLINREDCPFLFYRAIETIAKEIIKKQTKLEKLDWDEFHKQIGTTSNDMKLVWEISREHRHGRHMAFNTDQHIQMMTETKTILIKAIQHILKQPNTSNLETLADKKNQ
ncbi:MAG: hypothetical protein KGH62_03040 [Candidatus Micrarchaeota archaeon]|nr:hypothetical protein [Candidatus Micrarchaeota archaeon]